MAQGSTGSARSEHADDHRAWWQGGGARYTAGLILGLVLFVVMLLLPAPAGMTLAGWRTAAVGTLMAIWWVTEAIPIPATALIPVALFPILGILDVDKAAAPYANPIIALFLGGFLLAQSMQQWMLHRRIALGVLSLVGARPDRLVAGFMIATAFLSAWISNTATAVMMLPIGLSVVRLVSEADAEQGPLGANFKVAIMLGIAYACSIGGLATLIGSPPNALFAGVMADTYGVSIGFGEYMLVGVPIVLIGLPLTWLVLTRWIYPTSRADIPGAADRIQREWTSLGAMSRGEKTVGIIFGATAIAWIIRPLIERVLPGLSDAGIAILAAMVLFVTPVNLRRREFALSWESARELPWEILVLFGGGLSLASAITTTKLADWIGSNLTVLEGLPVAVAVLVVTATIIFLTELTSNTATAAAFIPIVAALAVAVGAPPVLLATPAALAASCAFMLPVATPPNAVVFSGGYVTVPQMARAGIVLNFLFIAIIAGPGSWLVLQVFR
ncbi:MAG: DASS family sodium-coupled anion symporter [Gemmatimonadetes bacterium]|nr:DASS family sodium-coupled anion symporter [Gemmatimonadota bacterium]MCC6771035.1 DASS family sodium-coupled anion symporter [Gemmatimonadaceae bacterium]